MEMEPDENVSLLKRTGGTEGDGKADLQNKSSRNWKQFLLLLWKNWLLLKKKKIRTVLILLFPILLALFVLLLRTVVSERSQSKAKTYDSFVVNTDMGLLVRQDDRHDVIAYAPNNSLVTRIMNSTANLVGVTIPPDLGFDSENALEEYVATHRDIFCAIVFVFPNGSKSLPKKIIYKIRPRSEIKNIGNKSDSSRIVWHTNAMFSEDGDSGPRVQDAYFDGYDPGYYREGFLAIQKAVDLSLIAEVNPSFDPTQTTRIGLKRYPFPSYTEDGMANVIRIIFPLFTLLSFIIIAPTICQEIVLEKENKFKESMKLMGMRNWLYWSSWFVKYLLLMLISVIIMTIIYNAPFSRNGPVLMKSSSTVVFVFFLLYCVSIITFCFAVSTFVFKASYGSAAGGVFFILTYVPFYYVASIYDNMSLATKMVTSLDFNIAMCFGCLKIAQYEKLGIGACWGSIWSSGDGHTLAHILIMLLVDAIIYSIFTWYLDAVIPGEFGTSQPYLFPFTKDYWFGTPKGKQGSLTDDFMTLIPQNKRQYFEDPLRSAKPGIQIRGLTKQFGSKIAVNDLNIDMYEGNITALLGHNGAGKTTAMFMLTGFLPPSKGTAYINGLNIAIDMNKIRESLGLCPQHDILFDTLTVTEHLRFFAILKGCPDKRVDSEVTEMIEVLHMKEKSDAQAKTLSGGQKRKLSVGIALIFGSKFVILDEPTSGMDPEARRQTWDILQSQRKGRTMILSTHFMDEADLLGDRIAIMSNGEIQCYGTPMFLKNKYGVGYQMTIVKSQTCNVDLLRVVITFQIPTAKLVSNEAAEVIFVLPSNQSSKFERLFKTLETDGETLGIKSFGVSVTTMEEVFLKVKDPSKLESGGEMSSAFKPDIFGNFSPDDERYDKEIGCQRQLMQLRAMLYKRAIHSMRNYVIFLMQILIPVVFTILACCVLLNPSRSFQSPPLNLNLTHFTNPITPYNVQPKTEDTQRLASCYKDSVSKQSQPVDISAEPGYTTMDAYLLKLGTDHLDQYDWNYQIGATIAEDSDGELNIIGYFNNQAYHTIAISLSFLGNTLMRCFGNKSYHIETINHPLPMNTTKLVLESVNQESPRGFGFAYCISFGMAFLFSTFLIFLIKEKKSGAKHSQLVSGVRLYNFWLATFLWDYVNYLVPCILTIAIILGFQTDGYCQHVSIVLLELLLYGWSMLSFTYLFSLLFDEASVGFVWLSVINITTGTLAPVIVLILQLLTRPSTWKTVEYIFYAIFPNYCFSVALQNIYKNHCSQRSCSEMAKGGKLHDFCASVKRLHQMNLCCRDTCGERCIEMVDNYLSLKYPGVGVPTLFVSFQGIAFFLILTIVEMELLGNMFHAINPNQVSQAMLTEMDTDENGKISEDSDVANERQRVHSTPIQELIQTDSVVTQDLTKLFGDFVAVNQLSIGVSQKECFGLLGVNGAGKTTSFKMLTGEIRPSLGSAYVAGLSVQKDLSEVRQKIGYCPQFDCIIDQLTVHETLWMYACAHGIPAKVRQAVIDRLIERLTLTPFTKKLAGTLSGGNKRKLCVAVALMGNPTVVFLDEPTTGVDPEARRHVWNTLAAARNTGATIILTSHSMEECEAICTRLGVLVNGRFLCLGSLQHLRDKFSEGYTLIIKLKRPEASENTGGMEGRIGKMKTFISETFPDSLLKDHHENLLNYQVKTRVIKWSEIFKVMEAAKVKYEIEDYSVGQTTLEQLFIAFARQQRAIRKISSPKKCLGLC